MPINAGLALCSAAASQSSLVWVHSEQLYFPECSYGHKEDFFVGPERVQEAGRAKIRTAVECRLQEGDTQANPALHVPVTIGPAPKVFT